MMGADAVNVMTSQISRYPAGLVDVVHLSERVVIRPVLPQDRELISAFFDDLAADARCNWFMQPYRTPGGAPHRVASRSGCGRDQRGGALYKSWSQLAQGAI